MWIVMKVQPWSSMTAAGFEVGWGSNGDCIGFALVFGNREDAVAFAGGDEHVCEVRRIDNASTEDAADDE